MAKKVTFRRSYDWRRCRQDFIMWVEIEIKIKNLSIEILKMEEDCVLVTSVTFFQDYGFGF